MNNEEQKDALTEEEIFRQKTHHYLVCFIESCPLHQQCLRWLVGQYVDPEPLARNAINPRNPSIGGEHCGMYREKRRAIMKRGLTRFYLEMPKSKERLIRQLLILWWGRKQYFEARKGERLITPEMQDDVVEACRRYEWTGPIVYDGEEESWWW